MNEARKIDATTPEVPRDVGQEPLRLDRRFLLVTLIAATLLSWPLLAFGRPFYIQDSVAYYKGGQAAVSFVTSRLDESQAATPAGQGSQAAPPPQKVAKQASGVRSVTYSAAAYLLSAPHGRMILLTICQALATAVVMVATLGAFGGLSLRRTIPAMVVVAATSTAALVSHFAVADIFAGLLIGSMLLLAVASSRLSVGIRSVLLALAAFGMTAHGSHLPLTLGLTMIGLGWVLIGRFVGRPSPKWTWAWVVAPLLIGGLTTVAVNRIAFGETSLTSKRYPFALARSVNDGPARWYLQEHCPERRFTICELYPHGLPKGGALEFLWGPDGIVRRATPEQLDRIRKEEADLVLAAGREYAGFELRRLTLNVARQLVLFEPYMSGQNLILDGTGTPKLTNGEPPSPTVVRIINIVTALSAALGALWLAWAFFARRGLRPAIALLFLGILGNAATCILFSAVAHRYQARVVWLIPLYALALGASADGRAAASGRDRRADEGWN